MLWRGARADGLRASLVLGTPRRVADLGCGRGELGRLLLPSIPGARVDGFDADPEQVAAGRAAARADGLAPLRFEEADAREVPRPDASYDLVCCQALLTHLSRPREVVAEMTRLVRPGGVVAVLEPALGAEGVFPEVDRDVSHEQRLASRLAAATAGAARTGVGSWDVARGLAELVETSGLDVVRAWTEPGVMVLTPPYGADGAALAAALMAWEADDATDAEAETLRWLAIQGGADPAALTAVEATERARRQTRRAALRAGTWSGAVHRPMAVVVARSGGSL